MLESQDGRHSIFSTDLLHFWLVCPFLEQLKQMCNMCLRGHKQVTLVSAESESEVAQSYPTLCDPMDRSNPVPGILQATYSSGMPFPFPADLPYPGIEPRSPTLQADALPSEPPGKPGRRLLLLLLLSRFSLVRLCATP